MKSICRILFLLIVCFYSVLFSAAQSPQKLKIEEEPWRVLENAQLAYNSGSYGEAIRLAEKAKLNRIAQCEWYRYALNSALRVSSIKHAGDSIDRVLHALKEDDLRDATAIVEYFIRIHTAEFFDNSISKLFDFATSRKEYPEAEYLLGKVYQIESEYDLAFHYYDKAWKNAEYLDVPDEKYDILYSIADLAYAISDFDKYETTLLLVLDADESFKDESFVNTYMQVLNNSRTMTPDRFFQLYRTGNARSIKACNLLAKFYEDRGEKIKSLTMSTFSAMAAMNHMSNVILDRDKEFEYVSLNDFFIKAAKYTDIVQWGIDNSVWESFYTFAVKVSKYRNSDFSQSMFIILAESIPEDYWRKAAQKMIER